MLREACLSFWALGFVHPDLRQSAPHKESPHVQSGLRMPTSHHRHHKANPKASARREARQVSTTPFDHKGVPMCNGVPMSSWRCSRSFGKHGFSYIPPSSLKKSSYISTTKTLVNTLVCCRNTLPCWGTPQWLLPPPPMATVIRVRGSDRLFSSLATTVDVNFLIVPRRRLVCCPPRARQPHRRKGAPSIAPPPRPATGNGGNAEVGSCPRVRTFGCAACCG